MLWLAGPVLISVSVALVIWPTKVDTEDPENPEKVRDWPVILGCLIGGVVAFKLWAFLVENVTPFGKAVKFRRGMQMFSSPQQQPFGMQMFSGGQQPPLAMPFMQQLPAFFGRR